MKDGENCIGAMVASGWYNGSVSYGCFRNNYGKRAEFLCLIRLEYDDGTLESIVTDKSWKWHASPCVYAELYNGEKYDARLEIKNWCSSETENANWKDVDTYPCNVDTLDYDYCLTVIKQEKFTVNEILIAPNKARYLDFRQNLAGKMHFKVSGSSGDRVILKNCETLDELGNLYYDNLKEAKQ